MLADKLLQLDYGAFHLTSRLCKVTWLRLSLASTDGLCTGDTFIAAMMEYSPYPADWAYSSLRFSASKQKHPVEHIRASVTIILVVFTLAVTIMQGYCLDSQAVQKPWNVELLMKFGAPIVHIEEVNW